MQTAETRGPVVPAADVIDVFVYVVVLNLAAEYLPAVISETFTLSLVTAVVLKIVLEVVVGAKNRVKARYKAATSLMGKVLAGVLLWLVLVGSKFLVLELVAFVLRGRVQLGGFFPVTGLDPRSASLPCWRATASGRGRRCRGGELLTCRGAGDGSAAWSTEVCSTQRRRS